MKLVERILLATDFSPEASDAQETAAFVARQFDSEILILHVMPENVEASAAERSRVEEKVTERLQRAAERLRAQGVEKVETLLRGGIDYDQIDHVADDRDVNVIVVGAGRTVEGGQFYLGDTAGRLRRKASRPVWVVKPGGSSTIGKVLCPVDFSEASARALRNAIHLARRFQGELIILTVIQSLSSYYDERLDLDEPQDMAMQTRLREFERFLRDFDLHDVRWRQELRRGKPHREILRLAREADVDLLVMGSVGRTGVSRLLIGGVARKVAQQMPCSIVTVRSEEPIRLAIEGEVRKPDANFCAARKRHTSCSRFDHGKELLDQGFADQALSHFQQCLDEYDLCPNAWQSMAAAHRRLGNEEEAEKCRKRAEELAQILLNSEIEADVRENHMLFRSIFGA
jgi:nucleotide-binding universal stress UspA family protein